MGGWKIALNLINGVALKKLLNSATFSEEKTWNE